MLFCTISGSNVFLKSEHNERLQGRRADLHNKRVRTTTAESLSHIKLSKIMKPACPGTSKTMLDS